MPKLSPVPDQNEIREMGLTHLMIDLETMGKEKNAALASLGAVFFDPFSTFVGNKFYMKVDLQSSIDAGLTINGSTIRFWLDQTPEARAELTSGPFFELKEVLNRFTQWLLCHNASPRTHFKFWSHATFDGPVLESAFKAVNIPWPFSYRAALDLRTLQFISPEIDLVREGVYHNALDDCLFQIQCVQEQFAEMSRRGYTVG